MMMVMVVVMMVVVMIMMMMMMMMMMVMMMLMMMMIMMLLMMMIVPITVRTGNMTSILSNQSQKKPRLHPHKTAPNIASLTRDTPHTRYSDNKTPLQQADGNNHPSTAELLRKYGGR